MAWRLTCAIAACLAAPAVAACGGPEDWPAGSRPAHLGGGSGDVALTLVAYSAPQPVYDELIPRFAATPAGGGVRVRASFGASADQSRAVAAGLGADVASFALEPDVRRLVDAGLVGRDWAATPTAGLVSRSVVVFVVRRGNPLGIRRWRDLLAPGIEVLTPSPRTSGAAKWNLLAAYGAAGGADGDRDAGLRFVRALLSDHVSSREKSAREALQSFVAGSGDVLLSYESEAITAQRKGQEIDYVVPDATILIEIPLVTVAESASPSRARAFAGFLVSRAAQERFAAWGHRPVHPTVAAETAARFPRPRRLFTIDALGGWDRVDREFFDPEDGAFTDIEREALVDGR